MCRCAGKILVNPGVGEKKEAKRVKSADRCLVREASQSRVDACTKSCPFVKIYYSQSDIVAVHLGE